ncbi:MAG TPA: FecR family protein [bacterium]
MKLKTLLALFIPLALLSSLSHADLEPSLGDIMTGYVIEDIQGVGKVEILKDGKTNWKNAREGQILEESDSIRVGDGTEVVLSLKSDTLIHLDEGTEVLVSELSQNQTQGFLSRLKLFAGAVLSDVKKNLEETKSSFEVEAGGVVCGVRGTVFEVAKDGQNVETTTHEGVVAVKTDSGNQEVKAGNTCSASKDKIRSNHGSNSQMKARFEAWKDLRQKLRGKMEQKHSHLTTDHKNGKTTNSHGLLGRSPALGGGHAGNSGGSHGKNTLTGSHPTGLGGVHR